MLNTRFNHASDSSRLSVQVEYCATSQTVQSPAPGLDPSTVMELQHHSLGGMLFSRLGFRPCIFCHPAALADDWGTVWTLSAESRGTP